MEKLRLNAQMEQRKVEKLKEMLARNKAKHEYEMHLTNQKIGIGSAYSVR